LNVCVVTGTRRDTRKGAVSTWLALLGPDLVIVGCATGVDAEARVFCQERGINHVVVPALWSKLGRKAGPHRNQMIACLARLFHDRGDVVVYGAFPDAESRGTHDAARRFEEAGITGGRL
jgi:hypothetical protein